jgi:hypothetical protein
MRIHISVENEMITKCITIPITLKFEVGDVIVFLTKYDKNAMYKNDKDSVYKLMKPVTAHNISP